LIDLIFLMCYRSRLFADGRFLKCRKAAKISAESVGKPVRYELLKVIFDHISGTNDFPKKPLS